MQMPPHALKGVVGFRIIEDADRAFLRRLYASTRAEEVASIAWDDEAKQRFLDQQFRAQDVSYQMQFPKATRRIITLDGADIGRLYLERRDDCLRMIEFSLLPEYRGRGIGTDILRSLLNEAHGGKVPVRLHVEQWSPALRLYLRHGFRQIGVNGAHLAMEWRPDTGPREI